MFKLKYKAYLALAAAAFLLVKPALAATGSSPSGRPGGVLLDLLNRLQHLGIMLGHQDDTFYGHAWHGIQGRSDVLETAGDMPAVMGFDLGGLETGLPRNLDGVAFTDIRREILAQHERGGVVTLSWHCRNLKSGKTAWDLQGGETKWLLSKAGRSRLDSALQRVADFITSLNSAEGPVPVILRLWHEMNGDWFWWGGKNTSPRLYRQLYRHTHTFLNSRCRGQIVWAYSPNLGITDFGQYYPGGRYVDLVGIDVYDFANDAAAYACNLRQALSLASEFGLRHGKIVALTETGCQQLPQPEWFTKTL